WPAPPQSPSSTAAEFRAPPGSTPPTTAGAEPASTSSRAILFTSSTPPQSGAPRLTISPHLTLLRLPCGPLPPPRSSRSSLAPRRTTITTRGLLCTSGSQAPAFPATSTLTSSRGHSCP
ncbi:hypothetical protein GQ53DRAFT_857465, partial [Thozetella sp. PMI_491]